MTNIPVAPGELVDTGYLNEVARAHYRKTTVKQVVNTAAETDLLNGEVTIGAGAMSTARMVRGIILGNSLNNSGATQASPRYKLKLGATTIIDTNVLAAAWLASGVTFGYRIRFAIANLGATNSQWGDIDASFSAGFATNIAATFAAGAGTYGSNSVNQAFAIGGNSAAVDTTAAQALAVTVTLPVANANVSSGLVFAAIELV